MAINFRHSASVNSPAESHVGLDVAGLQPRERVALHSSVRHHPPAELADRLEPIVGRLNAQIVHLAEVVSRSPGHVPPAQNRQRGRQKFAAVLADVHTEFLVTEVALSSGRSSGLSIRI